jgi:hypothetical protein
MKKINFFEGSNLFLSETTDLNVSEGYIQYKLANQYEYRPTTESLWADVIHADNKVDRYLLDYEHKKLNLHLQYNLNN